KEAETAARAAVPAVLQAEGAPAGYLQEIHLAEEPLAMAAAVAPSPAEAPAEAAAVPVAAAEARKAGNKSGKLDKLVADEELLRKEPASMPQSKSVRIALERLDRMMNAVGELVINRTRMLGRVAELERLADVLNFSKARMQDKVAEFQEKYEFG